MRKSFRWLGHVLRTKDDRLPKMVLCGQPAVIQKKEGGPKEGLKENSILLGVFEEGSFTKMRMGEEQPWLARPYVAWCCIEWLIVVSHLPILCLCVFFTLNCFLFPVSPNTTSHRALQGEYVVFSFFFL